MESGERAITSQGAVAAVERSDTGDDRNHARTLDFAVRNQTPVVLNFVY
jgi:hypothetical protein